MCVILHSSPSFLYQSNFCNLYYLTYTSCYHCISGSYLCHASFSMPVTLHLMPLSTSWPWLFTLCLLLPLHNHGPSPHASLHLMPMAIHIMPLSPSPSPWLFISCLSPPLHDHGFSPHASLHFMVMALPHSSSPYDSLSFSMTAALHLIPLSTS